MQASLTRCATTGSAHGVWRRVSVGVAVHKMSLLGQLGVGQAAWCTPLGPIGRSLMPWSQGCTTQAALSAWLARVGSFRGHMCRSCVCYVLPPAPAGARTHANAQRLCRCCRAADWVCRGVVSSVGRLNAEGATELCGCRVCHVSRAWSPRVYG